MYIKRSGRRAKYFILLVSVLLSACGGTPVKKVLSTHEANPYSHNVFRISELAEDAYQTARWSDAALFYQQLTKSVPNDAYVWFRLANTYVRKGEYKQAIDAYETSIERDGLQPKPWFNLSTTYLLNAKAAMLRSWDNLRADDPARVLIMKRVSMLDVLLNTEMEKLRVSN